MAEIYFFGGIYFSALKYTSTTIYFSSRFSQDLPCDMLIRLGKEKLDHYLIELEVTGIYSSQCTRFLTEAAYYYIRYSTLLMTLNLWKYSEIYVKIGLKMSKHVKLY